MTIYAVSKYLIIVDEIGNLNWSALTKEDLIAVASAYYYFSIQFREALLAACQLYPTDRKLSELHKESATLTICLLFLA